MRRSLKGSFVASLSPQIAAQEIEKSAWASRGWTLQEYALQKGLMFHMIVCLLTLRGKIMM
jgi:hypothetical protein